MFCLLYCHDRRGRKRIFKRRRRVYKMRNNTGWGGRGKLRSRIRSKKIMMTWDGMAKGTRWRGWEAEDVGATVTMTTKAAARS